MDVKQMGSSNDDMSSLDREIAILCLPIKQNGPNQISIQIQSNFTDSKAELGFEFVFYLSYRYDSHHSQNILIIGTNNLPNPILTS
jgi:hypothetical protein